MVLENVTSGNAFLSYPDPGIVTVSATTPYNKSNVAPVPLPPDTAIFLVVVIPLIVFVAAAE